MKSFKEFISEAETQEKYEYDEKRSSDGYVGRRNLEQSSAVVNALKHAHSAKLRGDTQRHAYWLSRAYSKLTGSK